MPDDTSTTQTSESSAPPTAAADSLASPAAGNAASENAENQALGSENPETPPDSETSSTNPALAAADTPESRTAQIPGNEPFSVETPPDFPAVSEEKLDSRLRGNDEEKPLTSEPEEGNEPFKAETVPGSTGVNNTPRPLDTPLDKGEFYPPRLANTPQPSVSAEATADTSGTASLPADRQVDRKEENQQDLQAKKSFAREFLVKAREIIQSRKRKKLDKVMTLFLKHPRITNDEVEKLLHVSDATATRLLSQLEKENRIRQIGKTGRAVLYEKV